MLPVHETEVIPIDIIVCYHGGVVSEDANGQLRRVIQEISHERDQ